MPCRHPAIAVAVCTMLWHPSLRAALGQLEAFAGGKALLYLDVPADSLVAEELARPLSDFRRCFRLMTGTALPGVAREVAAFDPARGPGLRLEATVLSMEDHSAHSTENGSVLLLLTPTQRLDGHPLAAPGEKASWGCTWQRGAGKLQFSLVVANQPYYGPGYGPFTFVTLEAPAPDWPAGRAVQLALELRRSGGQDLRGGYRMGAGEWVYTDWCDPARAGSDRGEPGVSDKNGPQAWAADWPTRWAGKAAACVAGYAAKSRESRMRVDDVRVRCGEEVLFGDGFDAPDGTAGHTLPRWRRGPAQGSATVEEGALVLQPDPAAWNTAGLLAAAEPPPLPEGVVPLRLELRDVPAGTGLLDSAVIQGWEREVTGQGVTLSAYTRLGLQNALYALLDRWGCRWVMVGDLGECLPRVKRLAVPLGTVRSAPRSDFSVEPCGSGTPYADFFERNQGGYQNWLTAQHYWFYAIPPEKHFGTHPEWYALVAGKRQPTQLCTSNPEVVAEMIRVARGYLAGGRDRVAFPMDPEDRGDFCECDNCRALDPPRPRAGGAPVVTDRVLHFVNQVAAAIEDEFPDRYVGFYAYASHADLPVRERPAPNVVVGITRCNHCLLHLTPTPACPTSDFHRFVSKWRQLTPNVFAYEYDPISWTGGLPCPTWLDMGRSLHTMLVDGDVLGSYSDGGVLPAAWAGTFLNRYLPLRMKVNPRQRPEDVLHDMCQAFFGPAAVPLEQHYLEMAKVTERPHPGMKTVSVGTTFYHRLFDPKQIRRARALLDEGIAAAQGQSPYEQRVGMVDLAQRYLEGYLGGVWAAQAKDYDQAVAEFARMDQALAALIQRGWAEATDAPGRARVMRMKPMAESFPERLGYVTEWQLLGPFDNTALASDKLPDPFEPVGSLAPVSLPGGTRAAWWAYRSPGGLLNLERALAPKQGKWTLSYAYAATTYAAPRAQRAQIRLDSFFPFRLFVNGKEVLYKAGCNADCPDRLVADVHLRQGPNLIIAKCSQTGLASDAFPWGLYLRVVPNEAPEATSRPELWQFQTDPGKIGVGERWFAADHDDAGW